MADRLRRLRSGPALAALLGACSADMGTKGSGPDGGSGGTGGSGGAGGNGGSGGSGGAPDSGGGGAPADSAPPDSGPPPPAGTCPDGSRPGPSGKANDQKTSAGLMFNLRTPSDYKPTAARPLIVVYSPNGGDRNITEGFMMLTTPALARGNIIAYADHLTPSNADVDKAFGMMKEITERWCVDTNRIYGVGHSDGATVLNKLAANLPGPPMVAAIAPNASGNTVPAGAGCSMQAPFGAIVMHSSGDTVFPGKGKPLADWYVRCMECDATPKPKLPNGCIPFGGCRDGVQVEYCEATGPHASFPTALAGHILDFFAAHHR